MARADNSLAQDNKTLAQSLIYKPGPPVASPTGRKIQPKQCNATRPRLLHVLDYDTELYVSGEAFISSAAASQASCLLVDIQLGGMSGIELRRRLAACGFATPVIFMTGSDNKVILKEALKAGCVALLRKPFPENLLMDAIDQALS